MTVYATDQKVKNLYIGEQKINKGYSGSSLVYSGIDFLKPGTVLYTGEDASAPPDYMPLSGVADNFENIKYGIRIDFGTKSTSESAAISGNKRQVEFDELKFPSNYSNPLYLKASNLQELQGITITLDNSKNTHIILGKLLLGNVTDNLLDGHIKITPTHTGSFDWDTTLTFVSFKLDISVLKVSVASEAEINKVFPTTG